MGFHSRKNTQKTKGIVVGGGKKPVAIAPVDTAPAKRAVDVKQRRLIIASVAAVSIVLTGVWFVYDSTVNVSVYDIPDMGSEVTSPPAKDETPFIEPAKEAAAIKEQIATYPSSRLSARQKLELANLYSALGAAYSNDGQGELAIEAYETADSYASNDQKRAIIGGLAYAHAAMGQTEQAIQAFEELIDLIETKQDAFSKRDIAGYEREIEKLKNGEAL